MTPAHHLARARFWLVVMIVGLVVSGVTAFPLELETRALLHAVTPYADRLPAFVGWIARVHGALADTGTRYPFLAYGTDWLAFAHLTIAVAFLGPLRDPVRNVWVVQFGMIACLGVVPLALIAGPVRGIPWFWTCVDLSFGIFGLVPLLLAYRHIRALEGLEQ